MFTRISTGVRNLSDCSLRLVSVFARVPKINVSVVCPTLLCISCVSLMSFYLVISALCAYFLYIACVVSFPILDPQTSRSSMLFYACPICLILGFDQGSEKATL